MLNLSEGKNFKLRNAFGIHYDLYNPSIGENYLIRIYDKCDLLVDGTMEESPKDDYWIVMNDLDGKPFAQPIDSKMLAEKLMTFGFVPIKK